MLFDKANWNYVNTNLNPADIGTRNISVKSFVNNSLWWYGPSYINEDFVLLKDNDYPGVPVSNEGEIDSDVLLAIGEELDVSVPERFALNDSSHDSLVAVNVEAQSDVNSKVKLKVSPDKLKGFGNVISFERFSKLKKLLRVLAYVFRFIKCCKNKISNKEPISAEEMEISLKRCIQRERSIFFIRINNLVI